MQRVEDNQGNFGRRQPAQQQRQQLRNLNERQPSNLQDNYQEDGTKQQRLQLELVPPPATRRQQQQRQRIVPLKATIAPTVTLAPYSIGSETRNNTKNSFRGHMKYSQAIQSSFNSNTPSGNSNSLSTSSSSSNSYSSSSSSSSTNSNSRNDLFNRNHEKMKFNSGDKNHHQQFNTNERSRPNQSHTKQQGGHTAGHGSRSNNPNNARQRQPQMQHLGTISPTKKSSKAANSIDNDELKDYKSKIKNKYNIDYDHSLDAEYEIIEAIE